MSKIVVVTWVSERGKHTISGNSAVEDIVGGMYSVAYGYKTTRTIKC